MYTYLYVAAKSSVSGHASQLTAAITYQRANPLVVGLYAYFNIVYFSFIFLFDFYFVILFFSPYHLVFLLNYLLALSFLTTPCSPSAVANGKSRKLFPRLNVASPRFAERNEICLWYNHINLIYSSAYIGLLRISRLSSRITYYDVTYRGRIRGACHRNWLLRFLKRPRIGPFEIWDIICQDTC